jgi:hypothetical protein
VKVYEGTQARHCSDATNLAKGCELARYRYLLVWSRRDARPLIAVLAMDAQMVVSILYADRGVSKRIDRLVSEDSIALAKERAADALSGKRLCWAEEIVVAWLDTAGQPKRKTLQAQHTSLVTCDHFDVEPTVRSIAREVAGDGYQIWAVLRSRTEQQSVSCEISLD